jgi:hypothetical protein
MNGVLSDAELLVKLKALSGENVAAHVDSQCACACGSHSCEYGLCWSAALAAVSLGWLMISKLKEGQTRKLKFPAAVLIENNKAKQLKAAP